MKAAVLGAGGVGLGTTALLASKGADVRLWSRSADGTHPLLDGRPLVARGAIVGDFPVVADLNMASVVEGADVVIVAVPSNGMKETLDRLAPLITAGTAVVISAHLSFAALYLHRVLAHRGVAVPVCAWATTAVTGRRTAAGLVEIATVRKRITAATLAGAGGRVPIPMIARLLGIDIETAPSLLAVTLDNVNPTSHAATALCNLTRMEYGERWGSYRGISGVVARLIERLDSERIALAARFGVVAHSLPEHWHASFGVPLGSISEMAAEQDRRRDGGPAGPTSLDHRFVIEDLPFGIVPNIALGEVAGLEMTTHRACLHLFDTLYGRDFGLENDLLPGLAIGDMPIHKLSNLGIVE